MRGTAAVALNGGTGCVVSERAVLPSVRGESDVTAPPPTLPVTGPPAGAAAGGGGRKLLPAPHHVHTLILQRQ